MKNHYQILGVPTNCSQAEIKKAYRQLALQHHPDKNSGNSESEEIFKEILESYIILSDEETRSEYDYIRGSKSGYLYHQDQSKPSPIKFLVHFKKIKDAAMHTNGHMNKKALFKVVDGLLTDDNLNFLIRERDISINNLIIDELITIAIFMEAEAKQDIMSKLKKLADGNIRMLNRIETLNESHSINSLKYDTGKTPDITESPPATVVILMFILFILLFLLLFFVL